MECESHADPQAFQEGSKHNEKSEIDISHHREAVTTKSTQDKSVVSFNLQDHSQYHTSQVARG